MDAVLAGGECGILKKCLYIKRCSDARKRYDAVSVLLLGNEKRVGKRLKASGKTKGRMHVRWLSQRLSLSMAWKNDKTRKAG